jgi:hypothetical protein
MNAPLVIAPAIDLLADAVRLTRQYLEHETQLPCRVRVFWAAVAAGRYLGAADVVHDEFFQLAVDAGLFANLQQVPPYAATETIEHLIRWGMRRRNPFGSLR